MLGTYRLMLALLVALSHVGVSIAGLNPGVVAVVGFYLVSGYVMTGLLRAHYSRSGGVAAFYLDRILRLFPHYLAVAAITFAWFVLTGAHTEYLRIRPTIGNLVENALVVPLNFYMFNRSDEFTLIPPAWSLGAEIQFYVVIPLLLLPAGRRLRLTALGVSVGIYLFAASGIISSDFYGYRLLPGVLFMFLFGSFLYDTHQLDQRRANKLAVFVIIVTAGIASLLHFAGKLALPYNSETMIGLVLGVVALQLLGNLRRRSIDDAIGNLSYGVFLNHFLVMWVFFDGRVVGLGATIGYLGASVLIAFLMYWSVERPILALRKALRQTMSSARTEVSAPTAGVGRRFTHSSSDSTAGAPICNARQSISASVSASNANASAASSDDPTASIR